MRYVGRFTASEKEFSKFTNLAQEKLSDFKIEYYDRDNKKQTIVVKNRLNEIYLNTAYNIRLTDIKTGAIQRFITGKPYIRLSFDNKLTMKKETNIYMYKKDRKEHYFIECKTDLTK